MQESITVRGARTHNLQNVSLTLPHGRLIVFTGVSGSGKSSLAFDTLYAEGQRRYIASLSNYARQFLDRLPRPDVDAVTGLPPSLSIDQKSGGRNPRSTVGTLTEISDFLRVLWARAGQVHCARCGRPVGTQSREAIVRQVAAALRTGAVQVLAPLVRGQRGGQRELLADLRKKGYLRLRVDGETLRSDRVRELPGGGRHDIDVVIDRLGPEAVPESRMWEAVEGALAVGEGRLILLPDAGEERACSTAHACPHCGTSCAEPTPASLSFNVAQGWCPRCLGLGTTIEVMPDWLVPDPSLSVAAGALAIGRSFSAPHWRRTYARAAAALGLDLDRPWQDLAEAQRHAFLHGMPAGPGGQGFAGIIPLLLGRQTDPEDESAGTGRDLAGVSRRVTCTACHGKRLRPESLLVRLGGRDIAEASALTLAELAPFLEGLELGAAQRAIASEALAEAAERLRFLREVGVGYLTVDRSTPTLSGGEAQRIRLAAQVGRGLAGVLYVLDEPSIGLHQRDNRRLIRTLQALRDIGSTVVVVEHDEETMRCADLVVDFGPGAGPAGGRVVASGTAAQLAANPASLTGRFLSGRTSIPVPAARRPGRPGLRLVGVRANNLKGFSVSIPAGALICVTGVSGSGKSSLVNEVLLGNLQGRLGPGQAGPADPGTWSGCRRIEGCERFDKIIAIDQSPIGRIPRSNAATYTQVMDEIRALYARLPEARVRGYAPGRFSFNVPGGRCPACEGNGATRIDMDFLADVWVPCAACGGLRFGEETLAVRFRDRSIADVLGMTVDAALDHFAEVPPIRRHLQTLADVGLGYLRLGQSSPTLSGGEAQRIKLARELARRGSGQTLYVLDEPTTGLHFADVRCLLAVLDRLVEAGNTVVVVEHNLDVAKVADHVIDLGPEGGAAGGHLLCAGTPEAVAACPTSVTGPYLKEVLEGGHVRGRPRRPAATAVAGGELVIAGARQHNLRNVSLRLPKERLIAFAGPSGAGKTSLALDVLYAEGQRRYVESLSAYARQFLGRAPRPAVDRVDGLAPAIAVDQRAVMANARSTVGTLTEIHDYLRLLFARAGVPHCPDCGGEVRWLAADQIALLAARAFPGQQLAVLAPADPPPDGLADWRRSHARAGYARYWQAGRILELAGIETAAAVEPSPSGVCADIALVTDRVAAADSGRLAEAIETALAVAQGPGRGSVGIAADGGTVRFWRSGYACAECGLALPPLGPHSMAFNDPRGWCPVCEGVGTARLGQWDTLVDDRHGSLRAGGVGVLGPLAGGPLAAVLEAVGRRHGFSLDTPLGDFTGHQREVLLAGDPEPVPLPDAGGMPVLARYAGLWAGLDRARRQTHSGELANRIAALFSDADCPACGGARIGPQGRAVTLSGRGLAEVLHLPLLAARAFFDTLGLPGDLEAACGEILREIRGRLGFLCDVGLGYLTLGRSSAALSGGEGQRIRLASQLGSGLTGVLYVLDEPTVGLHPRDTQRLLGVLSGLRALGNTVLAVDHDTELLAAADHLVRFGPGSGSQGGLVVAAGPPRPDEPSAVVPHAPRRPQGDWLVLRGARHHNLQATDLHLPLHNLVAVTGVSGSGKTSLIIDTLYADLARRLHRAQTVPGAHDGIDGGEAIDKVIRVDQGPIGDSPRSNAATYSGLFDTLRGLYARVPEARARGFGRDHFSYNHHSGRCDLCEGRGYRRVEMQFLPDVWVLCDACAGRRYRGEVLSVLYRGKSIADCLEMTVDDALARLGTLRSLRPTLEMLAAVGLGHLRLGQPAPTLSGGEAQRLKLARELARPQTGRTLYVLDEPTTGLAAAEVARLLGVLHGLVDGGNTVVVIEHDLAVIAAADWVVDLGPEGGAAGGRIVAAGPPEVVAADPASRLAPYLAVALGARPASNPREVAR